MGRSKRVKIHRNIHSWVFICTAMWACSCSWRTMQVAAEGAGAGPNTRFHSRKTSTPPSHNCNADAALNSKAKQKATAKIKHSSLERTLNIRAGSSPQSTTATTSPGNKKYSSAAESAMQTINSFTSSSSSSSSKNRQQKQKQQQHFQQQKQNQPPINLLSESALMDKETNAIYWQGGANIFSTSLTKPYLTQRGVIHVKATILTVALWLWVWGRLSRYLAWKYFESSISTTDGGGTGTGATAAAAAVSHGHKLLFSLPFITAENAPPFLQKIASFLTPILQFILLILHSLLYLRLPKYSPKVLVTTILLYLLEAYSCSTRRYLSHAMDAPAQVEAYLERLRSAEPCVTWKVRCFHYEEREFWKSCGRGVGKVWESWVRNKEGGDGLGSQSSANGVDNNSKSFVDSPSWAARKVVTHEAVGTYKFKSWEDHTLASLWKRAQSFSSTSQEAPFSKLTLSKLLVLKNKSAREDYFAQQAAFVMLEGRKDVHAEFATRIDLDGFRPKLLAVRPLRRASHISAALFRQHVYVLATLLGLSLPYRIWFARHCDEIRVTVVKETSSANEKKEDKEVGLFGDDATNKSSWFRGKWGWGSSASSAAALDSKRAQELFRKSMRSFALYEEEQPALSLDDQNNSTNQNNATLAEAIPEANEGSNSNANDNSKDDGGEEEAMVGEGGQLSSLSTVDNLGTDSTTTIAVIDSALPDSPQDQLSLPAQLPPPPPPPQPPTSTEQEVRKDGESQPNS